MPFPTKEEVRKAVEDQLCVGLENLPGDWVATLQNGEELAFRPGNGGEIYIEYCLDGKELENLPDNEPAEKQYRLRVKVETVE